VFEGFGLSVGPGQEIVDLAVAVAIDDLGERVGEIGLRIDVAELAALDERGDDRPVFAAAVRPGEERVLTIEGNRPFILPVLGAKSKFIIAGTRCTVGASLCTTVRCEPALG
jgi:hypothetical protein